MTELSFEEHVPQLLVFGLVLVRIAALVMVAPVLGSAEVSMRFRVGLAVLLAVLVAPLELAKSTALPEAPLQLLVLAGGEALVGLSLGLGVLVLYSAAQLAGRLISQTSGMQLAEVFDASVGAGMPVFSKLLSLATLAVFLTIGGHRRLLEALLDTFARLPVGQSRASQTITAATTDVLAESFSLGIRAAAPALVALLLATLILALAGRTLPQLNVIAMGFGANAFVALVAVSVSLGAACWVLQDALAPALETVLQTLRPT
jgi:flagellar biosynthetic protein FliR